MAATINYLQPPIPTSAIIKSSPPKNKTSTSHNEAKKDQQGTENNPLTVKAISPTKNQQETQQEKEDREEKATNDKDIKQFH